MFTAPVWRGRNEQAGILTIFTTGLVLGGLVSACVVWIASGLISPVGDRAKVIVLAVCIAYALTRDLRLVRLPLPETRRQVPRSIFDNGIELAALRFGIELGTGVRTYVPASAPYLLAAALLLGEQPVASAIVVGVGFGLGRATMATQRSFAGSGEQWDARLQNRVGALVPLSAIAATAAAISLTVIG